jgi:hypothetical protein
LQQAKKLVGVKVQQQFKTTAVVMVF